MLYTSMINMGLRAITLVSKFLLILFMGKYMSIVDIGTYGLFTVTCTLLLNLVGFNFYSYNTRELINSHKKNHAVMLRDQAVFHLIAYAFTLPLIPLIFNLGILDWSLLGWLYVILILEHMCQEIERVLITFSRPITANVVLFIRSASWVYAIIATYLYSNSSMSLGLIWQYWMIGATTAILFGIYQLKFIKWKNIIGTPINFRWILEGVKSASFLFSATMLYQAMLFIDRSVLQYFHSEHAVGIYTFFWSISNAIGTFVYAGVISILHPKIILTFNKNQRQFIKLIKQMFWQSTGLFVIVFTILWFLLDHVLLYTGKEELINNKYIFFLLSIGGLIALMSNAVHYIIYCKKLDKQIMLATAFALTVDILANLALVPTYSIVGTAISISLALLALTVAKIFFAFKSQGT